MDKNKEIRRLQNEGKVSFDEMRNAANRTEKLAYAVQGIQINVYEDSARWLMFWSYFFKTETISALIGLRAASF